MLNWMVPRQGSPPALNFAGNALPTWCSWSAVMAGTVPFPHCSFVVKLPMQENVDIEGTM